MAPSVLAKIDHGVPECRARFLASLRFLRDPRPGSQQRLVEFHWPTGKFSRARYRLRKLDLLPAIVPGVLAFLLAACPGAILHPDTGDRRRRSGPVFRRTSRDPVVFVFGRGVFAVL